MAVRRVGLLVAGVACALLLLGALPGLAAAEPLQAGLTQGSLGPGDARLPSGERGDRYELALEPGQTVELDLVSRDFDGCLIAWRGDGEHYRNDNRDASTRNARLAFTAQARGTFSVLVTSARAGEQGRYALQAAIGPIPGVLTFGEPRRVSFPVGNGHHAQRFRLVVPDDALRLRAELRGGRTNLDLLAYPSRDGWPRDPRTARWRAFSPGADETLVLRRDDARAPLEPGPLEIGVLIWSRTGQPAPDLRDTAHLTVTIDRVRPLEAGSHEVVFAPGQTQRAFITDIVPEANALSLIATLPVHSADAGLHLAASPLDVWQPYEPVWTSEAADGASGAATLFVDRAASPPLSAGRIAVVLSRTNAAAAQTVRLRVESGVDLSGASMHRAVFAADDGAFAAQVATVTATGPGPLELELTGGSYASELWVCPAADGPPLTAGLATWRAMARPHSSARLRLDANSSPPLRPGRYAVAVALRSDSAWLIDRADIATVRIRQRDGADPSPADSPQRRVTRHDTQLSGTIELPPGDGLARLAMADGSSLALVPDVPLPPADGHPDALKRRARECRAAFAPYVGQSLTLVGIRDGVQLIEAAPVFDGVIETAAGRTWLRVARVLRLELHTLKPGLAGTVESLFGPVAGQRVRVVGWPTDTTLHRVEPSRISRVGRLLVSRPGDGTGFSLVDGEQVWTLAPDEVVFDQRSRHALLALAGDASAQDRSLRVHIIGRFAGSTLHEVVWDTLPAAALPGGPIETITLSADHTASVRAMLEPGQSVAHWRLTVPANASALRVRLAVAPDTHRGRLTLTAVPGEVPVAAVDAPWHAVRAGMRAVPELVVTRLGAHPLPAGGPVVISLHRSGNRGPQRRLVVPLEVRVELAGDIRSWVDDALDTHERTSFERLGSRYVGRILVPDSADEPIRLVQDGGQYPVYADPPDGWRSDPPLPANATVLAREAAFARAMLAHLAGREVVLGGVADPETHGVRHACMRASGTVRQAEGRWLLDTGDERYWLLKSATGEPLDTAFGAVAGRRVTILAWHTRGGLDAVEPARITCAGVAMRRGDHYVLQTDDGDWLLDLTPWALADADAMVALRQRIDSATDAGADLPLRLTARYGGSGSAARLFHLRPE